ncbi:hypothetical protein Forpe1208_v014422 [Fusarium oxysporum f. sp. rapae]|uniref:Uncharacterized protein n=1 Tax=Fusarium oxysporum f. sp. rapae TaxID=485398 RepID=A0A8J5NTQ0_FUSOX|nr:hypothetical protein Forpe1208_v014422 [Fusarium oxysporum f. sp. rapae]
MKAAGLYSPRPLPPFPLLTLDVTIKSLQDAHSPTYFGSEEDSPLRNHSGKWRVLAQPNTGLFGAKPATNIFGGQPFINPSMPATGGLIGGQVYTNASQSLASGPFSTSVVEKNDELATLVRHHCRLKDLIDPLLRVTEAEIKGLKLDDYPRP